MAELNRSSREMQTPLTHTNIQMMKDTYEMCIEF